MCCSTAEFGIADKYSSDFIRNFNTVLSTITTLLSTISKLIEDVLTKLNGLPPPSAYARLATWHVWQEKATAILNLRPPTNQGLPIEVLHPVFATFRNDVSSMRLDKWSPKVKVNIASRELCEEMACSFEDETARLTKLTELLRGFGLDMQNQYHIQGNSLHETRSARPGLHLSAGKTVLLGELKAEFENGDPYVQVSRSYQALVHNLERRG